MTIRIVSALARPVRGALVTTVAVLLAVSAAQAQAPAPAPAAPAPKAAPPAKKPAPPKPTPAPPAQAQQPAPPQQQPGQQAALPSAEIPQLVYSPWTKLCGPPPNAPKDQNAKLVCFTEKVARTETGVPVVAAALIEMEGEQNKSLRVTLPFGLAVAIGTRIIIDQNPPLQAPFLTCAGLNPNMGCFTQYEATPDLVSKMKKGQMLTIQAMTLNQQVANYPLSLADFAKANEGPATDPQQLEAQQKKQQEELQKKADELRKKLEEQKK